MNKAGREHRRVTLRVFIGRWALFLFAMSVFVIFLYIAGSSQGFMDSTLVFLLKLLVVMGIFLVTGAVFGLFYTLFLIFRRTKGKRYIMSAVFYLLFTIFGTAAVLGAVAIISFSGGNTL